MVVSQFVDHEVHVHEVHHISIMGGTSGERRWRDGNERNWEDGPETTGCKGGSGVRTGACDVRYLHPPPYEG